MHSKNIILSSLRESFISVWKNKSLFAFLFILQILFFSALSYLNYTYSTKIIESSQAIYEYLGRQNLDEASAADKILQQKNILGDDPLMISRNFNEIVKNFRIYAAYAFALLVIFLSVVWALSSRLIGKIDLKFKEIFFRNFVILLFYLGMVFLFFFSLINISIIQLTTETSKLFAKYIVFIVASIILSYFMIVSLALASKTELKNIVQKTLLIGIKKVHYILAVYFINILLLLISAFLFYYFIEKNAFALMIAILLLVFSFVIGRILMISVVDKLEN